MMRVRTVGVWAFLIVCTVGPWGIYAQANSDPSAIITLADYAAQLANAEADLARSLNGDVAAYDAAQANLAAVRGVRLAGDEVVYPPLLLEERAQIADADMQAHLVATLARVKVVQGQLAAAAGDESAARLALLQQVLARPEFSQPESVSQRLQRWLSEFWSRLFPVTGGQAARGVTQIGPIIFWAIVIIGGGALIWLLSYWLQGLLGGLVGNAEARRQASNGLDAPLTAQAAREQATRLAQDGSYRQAVRQLYLSALLTLDERGVIQYDRSLTNREVLTQVQRQAQVERHLHPVVDTFDQVWYGEREPDREMFDLYEREIEELGAASGKAEE